MRCLLDRALFELYNIFTLALLLFFPAANTTELHHYYFLEQKCNMSIDIDGDQVFKLRYNASSPASSTSHGLPWNTYFNSKRSGFNGIRRRASCKGSPKCPNPVCWYRRQYQKENRVNFEQRNGIMVCHSCNTEVELVSCPAVKLWEVSEDKQWVTVYHHGKHTCIAVDKGISKEMKDDAVSAFQKSETPAICE